MALFGTANTKNQVPLHQHVVENVDAVTVHHYKLPTTLDEWEEQRMQRVMESTSNKKKSDSIDDDGEFKDFDFYSDMEQPMRYFEDLERKIDILKEGPQL